MPLEAARHLEWEICHPCSVPLPECLSSLLSKAIHPLLHHPIAAPTTTMTHIDQQVAHKTNAHLLDRMTIGGTIAEVITAVASAMTIAINRTTEIEIIMVAVVMIDAMIVVTTESSLVVDVVNVVVGVVEAVDEVATITEE
jgi:hypothetical protein